MRKIFSVIILTAVIFFCGQNNFASAQDIWLYTDRNGSEYYLRECSLPARSWSFAHVVKVSGNKVTYLAYRFDMVGDVPYSVCKGSTPSAFVNNPIIEKGKIAENPVAYKIWNDHLKPNAQEFFKANERGGRNSYYDETDNEIFATKFFEMEYYVLPKTITRTSNGFSVDVKLKNKGTGTVTIKYYFYNDNNINADEKNVTYYVSGTATPGGLNNIQPLDSVSRPIYRICKQYL